MEGVATDVQGGFVTVTIDRGVGAGTHASWTIGIVGDVGDTSGNAIVIEDTSDTLVITAQDTPTLDYNISFQLDGTKCFFTGTITNNTGAPVSNQTILEIINAAYFVRATYDVVIIGSGNRSILFHAAEVSIDEMDVAEVVSINGFYFTN